MSQSTCGKHMPVCIPGCMHSVNANAHTNVHDRVMVNRMECSAMIFHCIRSAPDHEVKEPTRAAATQCATRAHPLSRGQSPCPSLTDSYPLRRGHRCFKLGLRNPSINLTSKERLGKPTDPSRQPNVLRSDRHALRVNGAQVRVLEQTNQVRLRGLLKRQQRLGLPHRAFSRSSKRHARRTAAACCAPGSGTSRPVGPPWCPQCHARAEQMEACG